MTSVDVCFLPFSRRVWGRWACVALCLGMSCTVYVSAKQKKPPTKTVKGLVVDQAENPVSGAMVELNDISAGKKIAIYSQEGGRYQFADLEPSHDYEIQARYQSLSSEVRRVNSLDNRRTLVVNLTVSSSH